MIKQYVGDVVDVLPVLAAQNPMSYDLCVTSPPYFKLRDYQHNGQMGLESSAILYVENLRSVCGWIAGSLKDDGLFWLNLGDTYEDGGLMGMPWRVALSLKQHGWILRSAVIWEKTNAKPDGQPNRPSSSYEHVFLFAKQMGHYWNGDAIREEPASYTRKGGTAEYSAGGVNSDGIGSKTLHQMSEKGRLKRDVWRIPHVPAAFPGHYAAFPPDLVELCLKSSCPPGGIVLDPFSGTGTTGLVANRLDLDATLIEINSETAASAGKRIRDDAPLLNTLTTIEEII